MLLRRHVLRLGFRGSRHRNLADEVAGKETEIVRTQAWSSCHLSRMSESGCVYKRVHSHQGVTNRKAGGRAFSDMVERSKKRDHAEGRRASLKISSLTSQRASNAQFSDIHTGKDLIPRSIDN